MAQDRRGLKRVALTPTLSRVAKGEDDVREWELEELLRGRRRDKNGRFTGRDPEYLPRAVHDELARRKFQQHYTALYKELDAASARLMNAAMGRVKLSRTELRAIEMVFERTLGKVPDNVNVRAELEVKPWMKALDVGLVEGVVGSAEVIDVEPVTDDDLLWDEVVGGARPEPPLPPEPLPAKDDTELWEKIAGGG